jgi:hypothetical protein
MASINEKPSFASFAMFRYKFSIILLVNLIQASCCFGQLNQTAKQKPKFQLMAFGVISRYQNDSRISANTHSLMGYGFSIRTELPLSKGVKFVPGIEVLSNGLSFDSYYFAPGNSVLFDKNFIYNHTIRCYELGIPLLIRFNLTPREDVSYHSFYFDAGWEIKYNLSVHSTILNSQDGSLVYDGDISLPYENHFLGKDIGNYVVAGLGYVRNFLPAKNSVFFDLSYRYGLSRNMYTGNMNSNYLFFRNTSVSVGIGIRF